MAVGRMAADHLLDRYFRRFAFSGYVNALWSDRRQKGFENFLVEVGCPEPACLLVERPETLAQWEHVQQQLTVWIKHRANRPA